MSWFLFGISIGWGEPHRNLRSLNVLVQRVAAPSRLLLATFRSAVRRFRSAGFYSQRFTGVQRAFHERATRVPRPWNAGHVCFGNVFGLFPFRCGLFSFFFGWLSVAVEWRQLTFSERNLDLGLARFVAAALRFYLEAAASRRSLLFISMGTNTLLTRASNVQYVT